jgi:hypothetical protein
MPTLSIKQFAVNVGYVSTKVRSAADPYHAAYVKATPEQRKALRTDWMLGHLEGQGVSNPERVLSQGKGAGASKANVKAIDRASSDFRYMVIRPEPKAAEPTKSMRVAKDLRALAEAYLANFENAADAIKVLRAVAK